MTPIISIYQRCPPFPPSKNLCPDFRTKPVLSFLLQQQQRGLYVDYSGRQKLGFCSRFFFRSRASNVTQMKKKHPKCLDINYSSGGRILSLSLSPSSYDDDDDDGEVGVVIFSPSLPPARPSSSSCPDNCRFSPSPPLSRWILC